MESLHGRGGAVAAPVEPLSLGDILEVIDIPDAMKRVLCHLYLGSVQSLLDDVATGAIQNIAGLGQKQKHALLIGTDRVLDALYVVVREGGCRVCSSKSLLESTHHFLPKGMVLPVNLPDDVPRPSMMQPASSRHSPSTSEGWAANEQGGKGDANLCSQVPCSKERQAVDPEAESWIQLDEGLFVPCMWRGIPMCVPWREALSAGLLEAPAPPLSAAPLNEHVQFQARPLTRAAPAAEIPEKVGSLTKPAIRVGRAQSLQVAGNLPEQSTKKVLVREGKGGHTTHRSHKPKNPKSLNPSSAKKRTTTRKPKAAFERSRPNGKSKTGARRTLVRSSRAKVTNRADPGSSKLLQRMPQKRVVAVGTQKNDTASACTSPAVTKFVQKAGGMLQHRQHHAKPLQTKHRSPVHPNQLECSEPLTHEQCVNATPKRSLVINTASKARSLGPGPDSDSDGSSDSEDSFASPVRHDDAVPTGDSSDNSSGKRGTHDETALSPLSAARERYRRMQAPPHGDESSVALENRSRKSTGPTIGSADTPASGGHSTMASALAAAFDDVPQPDVLPTMYGLPMLNTRLDETPATQCHI
eukprot:INCI15467.1.p1 GENE.INCI15467.1~~INCI15467.1.p1  ORF type:complete len:584 (+),score=90.08 INCI15467.1:346-2097(+)